MDEGDLKKANEREAYLALWAQEGWNLSDLARRLEVSRQLTHHLMKHHGFYPLWKERHEQAAKQERQERKNKERTSGLLAYALSTIVLGSLFEKLSNGRWHEYMAMDYAMSQRKRHPIRHYTDIAEFYANYAKASMNGQAVSIEELCQGNVSLRTGHRLLVFGNLPALHKNGYARFSALKY